ncbi:MAG TPA: hypothetical protein VIA62_17230 [Thermoanaerobaculia bacterium]|nr:hypothetical protein [Thermoanaerobaculia bacterium]
MTPLASVLFSTGRGLPPPGVDTGSQYDFPLFKAFANARRYAQTMARENAEIRHDSFLREVPEPQVPSLETRAARNRARCEALLERCRALRFSDPEAMVLTADLAVNLAERFDLETANGAMLVDLQARAWAELGNARRVADDLAGAESALVHALKRAALGSGDPLLLAHLMDLTASLYIDLRRFDDARRLLDLVYAIYQQEGDSHSAGRALISKGIASSYAFDVEEVVSPLVQGLALLDGSREPKLVLVAVHNLLWYLVECGRATQAEYLFQQCRPLYAHFTERLDAIKAQWLEGRIAAALGDDERAEQRFRQTRAHFEEAGLLYDMALVSLDLAALWLRAGRTFEIREVIHETITIFRNRGIHREAISMLVVLRDALRKHQITETLIRTVAARLLRFEEPVVQGQTGS